MTTLNQPERARFLQTLENDDQFRHDVRSLLLSRELLELPERFAQFTSYVTTFIERQQALTRTSKPSTNVSKPSTRTSKPSTNASKPSTNVSKPSTRTSKPSTSALRTPSVS